MEKGRFGIYLWFYAVLAFILAFLGQILLCGLLLGFVIVAEKNEWLTRQAMQAFFLSIFASIVGRILDILNVFQRIPIIGTVFGVIFGAITSLVSLLVLIIVIVSLFKVAKGQDAGVPLLSKLANRAYGLVEQRVYTQAPPASYNQANQPAGTYPNYAQPQAPVQPAQQIQQPPAQTQEPPKQ